MPTSHHAKIHRSADSDTLRKSVAGGGPRLETIREPRPLAVSIKEFCRLCSIGRTTAWQLVREKRVEVRRLRGKVVVLMRSIDALLEMDGADK